MVGGTYVAVNWTSMQYYSSLDHKWNASET